MNITIFPIPEIDQMILEWITTITDMKSIMLTNKSYYMMLSNNKLLSELKRFVETIGIRTMNNSLKHKILGKTVITDSVIVAKYLLNKYPKIISYDSSIVIKKSSYRHITVRVISFNFANQKNTNTDQEISIECNKLATKCIKYDSLTFANWLHQLNNQVFNNLRHHNMCCNYGRKKFAKQLISWYGYTNSISDFFPLLVLLQEYRIAEEIKLSMSKWLIKQSKKIGESYNSHSLKQLFILCCKQKDYVYADNIYTSELLRGIDLITDVKINHDIVYDCIRNGNIDTLIWLFNRFANINIHYQHLILDAVRYDHTIMFNWLIVMSELNHEYINYSYSNDNMFRMAIRRDNVDIVDRLYKIRTNSFVTINPDSPIAKLNKNPFYDIIKEQI